jgi:hypothetical protein
MISWLCELGFSTMRQPFSEIKTLAFIRNLGWSVE